MIMWTGRKVPKSNGEGIPVMCEPGTSYFPRRVVEKYGRTTLEAITHNEIQEIDNEQSKKVHDLHKDV